MASREKRMSQREIRKALTADSIVLVQWDDACVDGEAGWTDKADVTNRVHRCISVGLVVHLDASQVVLATTWGQDPAGKIQYNTTWALPLGMVVKVEKLK
jgi:hypothetical protein